MKILVIALAVVVVLMGGGMAFLFMEMQKEPAPVVAAEDGAPRPAPEPVEETRDAIYTSLNPAFVITYKTPGGMRYLQTELQIMSYDLDVINEIDTNRPALRNNIIMFLSDQEFETIESSEGREVIRNLIKEIVQKTLRTKLPVQEIYYNTFVIQ